MIAEWARGFCLFSTPLCETYLQIPRAGIGDTDDDTHSSRIVAEVYALGYLCVRDREEL